MGTRIFGIRVTRYIAVSVLGLAVVADAASFGGGGVQTYELEEVISDLRVPTKMPAGAEKGSITQFFGPMIFVNKKVGWVESGGFMGKTTDGGKTWMPLKTRVSEDLFFLNENLGWAGCLYHTVDGGATWTFWKPSQVGCFIHLFFVDSKFGWALVYRSSIYHTRDGGRTWMKQRSGVTSRLRGMYFVNRSEGWVVSGDGEILHTSDGGKRWEVQQGKVGVTLFTIKFWDDKLGYAVGRNHYMREQEGQGVIFYTTDGGRNWGRPDHKLPLGDGDSGLLDVVILSAQESWVVGQRGAVLRTTDGGKTWEIISLDKPSSAPDFISAALVEQDGRDAFLILADKGGLYRIWLDRSRK